MAVGLEKVFLIKLEKGIWNSDCLMTLGSMVEGLDMVAERPAATAAGRREVGTSAIICGRQISGISN